MTEWARMVLLTLRRWLPNRAIGAVMGGEFAALEPLHARHPSTAIVTRMRKDARLRQHLWFERIVMSAGSADMAHPPPPAVQSIVEAACYAQ